jgi:hypothetical protein
MEQVALLFAMLAATLALRRRSKRRKPADLSVASGRSRNYRHGEEPQSPVVVQGSLVDTGEWRESTEFNSLKGDLPRDDLTAAV